MLAHPTGLTQYFAQGSDTQHFINLGIAGRTSLLVGLPQLIAHCRARLAPYKVPHQFHFVATLPKYMLGKIQRQLLRDRLQHEAKGEAGI